MFICKNNVIGILNSRVLFEYADKYDLYAYAEQSIFINVVDITCEIDGEQFNGGYDIYNRTAGIR